MTKENTSGMYTVVAGDTLSQIVTDQCGKTSLWKSVAADNNLSTPYRIFANRTVLKISCAHPTTPVAKTGAATHRTELPAVVSTTMPPQGLSKTPKADIATETLPVTVEFAEEAIVTEFPLTGMDFPIPETVASEAPPPAPTSAKTEKTNQAKISSYQFVASGSDLHGQLQTQLVLFNSEEEKRLGLPIERIDLKPSLAVPARDGNTAVFVRLKKIPAQPCVLLIGGINTPVDCTRIQAYSGKIPGTHVGARIMASIVKMGGPAGISFLAGGPVAAGIVVGVPQLIHLGIALREKSQERKSAATQKAVDKSKLALYRASLESDALSNALPKKELLQ